jgi:esterase/lipase
MSNNGGDEAVWFSAVCAAFAYLAQAKYPSVAMTGIFLIMLMWTFWSLLKMLQNRM